MTVNHSVRLANDQARQPAALVRALTPCKPISEDKLQALLLNPTFWPKGIAAVALAGRDKTGSLALKITLTTPQNDRYPQSRCPFYIDFAYAPALFMGLAFGGAFKMNGNKSKTASCFRSYVRISPSNVTMQSLVVNSRSGQQAVTTSLNPHDCRRSHLKMELSRRSREPRLEFINDAVRLFEEHAPRDFGVSRDAYHEALTNWFAKADSRYQQRPEETLSNALRQAA